MDGVVIDSEVLFNNADTAFFRYHEKVYNREEVVLVLAGMDLRQGTALLKEKYGLAGTVDELLALRQKLLEEEYRTHLQPVQGFTQFHADLNSAGFRSCIATAANEFLMGIVMDMLKLEQYFGQHIYKIADVGYKSKPDPAIYTYAAEKMQTDPAKCIVIEDAPKGIQAAKNAGMFCIGITTTFAPDRLSEADLVVDSFDQIDLQKL